MHVQQNLTTLILKHYLYQNNCSIDSLPRTHLSGGGCSTSVVEPKVNSYTQTRPPLVPTHRVGNERSAEHNMQSNLHFTK